MKVSFLVTYYNQREYVKPSLESILAINKPCDWEILVGDDGSTDRTIDEVNQYIQQYPNNIRLYRMPREPGMKYDSVRRASANRLYLLEHAEGEIFCALDGDDYFCDTEFIKESIEIFDKDKNISVIGFGYKYVVDGVFGKEVILPACETYKLIDKKTYLENYYLHAGGCVYKKNFSQERIDYLRNLGYFDDNNIVINSLNYGEMFVVNRPIYAYRQTGKSIYTGMDILEQAVLNVQGMDVDIRLVDADFRESIKKRYSSAAVTMYNYRYKILEILGEEKYHKYEEGCESLMPSYCYDFLNYKDLRIKRKKELRSFLKYQEQQSLKQILNNNLIAMKNKLKAQIKKLPGIKNLVQRTQLLEKQLQETYQNNQRLEKQLEETRYNAVQTGRQAVECRLKLKSIFREKINIVFVCHRPKIWESLHSVYDALKSNSDCNVYIVAIPNKKQLPDLYLNHEVYESEGAEEFWQEYGCINGYNYETKEWFDLKSLEPDYVFFQQPYNIARCEAYKSWNVAGYAKICYLNYFGYVNCGELYDECTPPDFLKDVSFYFTQNKKDHSSVIDRYKRIGIQDTICMMTGFPRYDNLKKIKGNSDIWTDKDHKRFRLVWTPRWLTSEGNCHFFDFKDRLITFCKSNDIELVFRPHPQAFLEWAAAGELTLDEQAELRNLFNADKRLHLDESNNYLDMFYSSDCLLTDPSSVINDYFLTEKPIIYATGQNQYDKADLLEEGLYCVTNWNQVEKILNNLIIGNDPLKTKRKQIIQDDFYINQSGAGFAIASILTDIDHEMIWMSKTPTAELASIRSANSTSDIKEKIS